MAKARSYKITLYPAGYDRGFLTSSFELFGKEYPSREITAAGMADLKNQIRSFAQEHGEPCRASVRHFATRKPPGFDKATKDLYYNMESIVPAHVLERLTAVAA